MKQYKTSSEKETKSLAAKIAKNLKSTVISLTGQLGAGKTTFVQGFAKGLNIKDKIISPTFVLIRQHSIPHTNGHLYHIDLYRLEDTSQITHLGLEEIIKNPENITIVEWAEKAEKLLPKNTVKINIEKIGQDQRRITVLNFPF